MKTIIAVLATAVLSIGAERCGCGPVHDPGGAGGSLNTGGSTAIGGFVGTGGDSAGGSAGADAAPACTNACCTTCRVLTDHGCAEWQVPQEECVNPCLNAENGPDLLTWPRLPSNATLEQILESYECTGGK